MTSLAVLRISTHMLKQIGRQAEVQKDIQASTRERIYASTCRLLRTNATSSRVHTQPRAKTQTIENVTNIQSHGDPGAKMRACLSSGSSGPPCLWRSSSFLVALARPSAAANSSSKTAMTMLIRMYPTSTWGKGACQTESGRSVSKQLESKESQSVPPCTQVSFWRGQPLWVCFDARCVLERTRAT